MKYTLTLVLIISCFFSHGQDSSQKIKTFDFSERANKLVGRQFSNFNVTTTDQGTFSNTDLANKIAFINFWFESCLPCISELEGLNKLYDTLKHNENFIFVSFTFDNDSTINKLKAKYNIKYPVFHITRAECYRLNFNNGFPASFVLNKKGVIKYAKLGGQKDQAKSTEEIMTKIHPEIYEQL